jgi:hypothetical protein
MKPKPIQVTGKLGTVQDTDAALHMFETLLETVREQRAEREQRAKKRKDDEHSETKDNDEHQANPQTDAGPTAQHNRVEKGVHGPAGRAAPGKGH